VQHAGLHDTTTSADTDGTPAGDQDTGPGKASTHHQPGRQALTG
jgi:hypothetical protein